MQLVVCCAKALWCKNKEILLYSDNVPHIYLYMKCAMKNLSTKKKLYVTRKYKELLLWKSHLYFKILLFLLFLIIVFHLFPSLFFFFFYLQFFLARSQNNKTNVFFAEILSHDFFWACVCFISFCHPLLLSLSFIRRKDYIQKMPLNTKNVGRV